MKSSSRYRISSLSSAPHAEYEKGGKLVKAPTSTRLWKYLQVLLLLAFMPATSASFNHPHSFHHRNSACDMQKVLSLLDASVSAQSIYHLTRDKLSHCANYNDNLPQLRFPVAIPPHSVYGDRVAICAQRMPENPFLQQFVTDFNGISVRMNMAAQHCYFDGQAFQDLQKLLNNLEAVYHQCLYKRRWWNSEPSMYHSESHPDTGIHALDSHPDADIHTFRDVHPVDNHSHHPRHSGHNEDESSAHHDAHTIMRELANHIREDQPGPGYDDFWNSVSNNPMHPLHSFHADRSHPLLADPYHPLYKSEHPLMQALMDARNPLNKILMNPSHPLTRALASPTHPLYRLFFGSEKSPFWNDLMEAANSDGGERGIGNESKKRNNDLLKSLLDPESGLFKLLEMLKGNALPIIRSLLKPHEESTRSMEHPIEQIFSAKESFEELKKHKSFKDPLVQAIIKHLMSSLKKCRTPEVSFDARSLDADEPSVDRFTHPDHMLHHFHYVSNKMSDLEKRLAKYRRIHAHLRNQIASQLREKVNAESEELQRRQLEAARKVQQLQQVADNLRAPPAELYYYPVGTRVIPNSSRSIDSSASYLNLASPSGYVVNHNHPVVSAPRSIDIPIISSTEKTCDMHCHRPGSKAHSGEESKEEKAVKKETRKEAKRAKKEAKNNEEDEEEIV